MSGPGSSSQGHSGSSGLSGPAYEGHLQHALRDSNGSLFKRTWELVDYAPKTAANCSVVFPSGPLPLVRSVPKTTTEAVGEASLGVYQALGCTPRAWFVVGRWAATLELPALEIV